MTCPKCQKVMHYVCSNQGNQGRESSLPRPFFAPRRTEKCSCHAAVPENEKPLQWDDTGELQSCPYCGLKAHADFWFERDLQAVDHLSR